MLILYFDDRLGGTFFCDGNVMIQYASQSHNFVMKMLKYVFKKISTPDFYFKCLDYVNKM